MLMTRGESARLSADVCLIQSKLTFQVVYCLEKSILGPGALRILKDQGWMKSPVLGPGFQSHQHTDWSGVCWAISSDLVFPRNPAKCVQGRSHRGHVCTGKDKDSGLGARAEKGLLDVWTKRVSVREQSVSHVFKLSFK